MTENLKYKLSKTKTISIAFIIGLMIVGAMLIWLQLVVSSGVNNLSTRWDYYITVRSEKVRTLSSLHRELGYGGMIHNFKNYILRGNVAYHNEAQQHLGAAYSALNNYKTYFNEVDEIVALDALTNMLDGYRRALDISFALKAKGTNLADIDFKVRVDDGEALQALEVLKQRAYNEIDVPENKSILLSQFNERIGYGGGIHSLKNTILRVDAEMGAKTLQDFIDAERILTHYELLNLNTEEINAIVELKKTINFYKNALNVATGMIAEGRTPQEIDATVQVDDNYAFNALSILSRNIVKEAEESSLLVTEGFILTLKRNQNSLFISMFLIIAVLLISIIANRNRSRYEEQLEKSEKLASKIAQKLGDQKYILDKHAIVAITDKAGYITYANEKFCEISRYSREELIGKKQNIINANYHSREFFVELWQTISKGEIWIGEIKNKARDGSYYWVQSTILPLLDEDREINGYIAMKTDISEQKQSQKEKDHAMEKLTLANNAKNTFFASMSHDLRTPLNAIIGFSDMLQHKIHGDLGAKKNEEYVKFINSSSVHLLNLVNDILDVAKMEAGEYSFEEEEVDMVAFFEEEISRYEILAKLKKIEVRSQIDQKIRSIIGDQQCLTQILSNLMSNAIKYSPENTTINVDFKLSEQGSAILQIKDSGGGFKEKMLKNIGNPYVSDDSYVAHKDKGTGLGIFICHKLVDLHQANIKFENRIEGGASVTIIFPETRVILN